VSGTQIQIQSRSHDEFVDASLLDGMAPQDLLLVEREWLAERSLVAQELLRAGVERAKWPQSLHWNWNKKAPQLTLLESSGFSIVYENQWQGVMLTKSASYFARLGADKGKPLVYIDFLEIAPWNWVIPEIGRVGRFRMVGSTLFWRAVKQSDEEGFHGRVGLHALPQSESFYERGCGMTPVGRDASKQNLLYFELSREDAQRHLQKGGDV
jgi:hypothetical protein